MAGKFQAEEKAKVLRFHVPCEKRTSQGTYGRPKNKQARRRWKSYRGQGKP